MWTHLKLLTVANFMTGGPCRTICSSSAEVGDIQYYSYIGSSHASRRVWCFHCVARLRLLMSKFHTGSRQEFTYIVLWNQVLVDCLMLHKSKGGEGVLCFFTLSCRCHSNKSHALKINNLNRTVRVFGQQNKSDWSNPVHQAACTTKS